MIHKNAVFLAARHFFKPEVVGDMKVKWESSGKGTALVSIKECNCTLVDHKSANSFRLEKLLYNISRVARSNPHWKFDIILSVGDKPNGHLCVSADDKSIPIPWWSRYADPELFIDPVPFEKKLNKICFYGSSTGNRKGHGVNQRIDFCNFSHDKEDITACLLKGHEWSTEDSRIPFLKDRISIEKQLEYKYVLNIDGNATSWDRLVWQMASNSVCLYLKPVNRLYEWYYPITQIVSSPFLWVTQDTIVQTKKYLDRDLRAACEIAEYGRDFVRDYLNTESCDYYVQSLFDMINDFLNK